MRQDLGVDDSTFFNNGEKIANTLSDVWPEMVWKGPKYDVESESLGFR